VSFDRRGGDPLRALDRVSLTVAPGDVLGVVGESGAGKSLTGRAVTGLLPLSARIAGGEIWADGKRIDNLPRTQLRRLRGRRIGAISQDAMSALDPLQTVGDQLAETISTHLGLGTGEARARAVAWLEQVGIPAPDVRANAYPHQLSGGMRQRVVVALALCGEPSLVIADEPTTALDVSVQAQIIALLTRRARADGTAILLITHDIGIVAEAADRVAVMYAGRVVEMGAVQDVLMRPAHPYTQGLIGSIPAVSHRVERLYQIEGTMPRLGSMPQGCPFAVRCPQAFDRCRAERPEMMPAERGHAACWLWPHRDCARQGLSADRGKAAAASA
jgi:peptide/nickel transport system ATP-binding protein